MSVYSGFATRQQQHKYNSLLETLVIALKKRLIKFYSQEECDESKFKLLVKKIYKKMYLLERGKFMTPKYSTCLSDLVLELSIDINYDTMSECSSVPSNITFRNSTDPQGEEMQSRNALTLKFNQLEKKEKERRQMSALSIPRSRKYVKFLAGRDEEEEDIKSIKMAEPMFHTVEELKPKRKFKGVVIGLKELRGTAHMPKWQNFAPKRSQIFPESPRRSHKNIAKSHNLVNPQSMHQTFRRKKYFKSDLKVQDI